MKETKVTFQNAAINQNLYFACVAVAPLNVGVNATTLQSIQVEFGRSLTKGCSKLYAAVLRIIKISSYINTSEKDLFLFVLEGLLLEFRMNCVKSKR